MSPHIAKIINLIIFRLWRPGGVKARLFALVCEIIEY
jgi:hypothetical protein